MTRPIYVVYLEMRLTQAASPFYFPPLSGRCIREREEYYMYRVTKRDGTIAEFDIAKISAAITKAFDALSDLTGEEG